MAQAVADFKVVADYRPAGDQPAAIAGLVEGLEAGLSHQTLPRRHRLGQDLYHRQCRRGDAAADAGAGAQQDPGGATVR